MTSNVDLNTLTTTNFKSLINSEFTTTATEAGAQIFELLEVTNIGAAPENDQRQAFSLLFRGANTQTPQQGMFELEHSQLGKLAVFLVPIGPDQRGMCYEAVFT